MTAGPFLVFPLQRNLWFSGAEVFVVLPRAGYLVVPGRAAGDWPAGWSRLMAVRRW